MRFRQINLRKLWLSLLLLVGATAIAIPGIQEVAGIEETIEIGTVDELKAFRDAVNSGNTYAGQTVKLTADLDLSGENNWTPIGNLVAYPGQSFNGTFDGDGHSISNVTSSDNTYEHAVAGLFGSVVNGTIKNLTVKNVNITSTHFAAGIVAYTSNGPTIENCKVIGGTITSTPELKGSSYDNGDKVGGIMGYATAGSTINNCWVEGVTLSAYRDLGGIVGCSAGTVTNNTAKNVTVTQDLTNGYKNPTPTTIGDIIGRDEGATLSNNKVIKSDPVAQIGETKYETIAEAVAAVNEGETIEVIKAGDYTLPNISKNVTIEGSVDGVVFNHTTGGSVASIPNGATFKNVTFNFGNVNYHGFQHAGTINMEGCTLNGKLFSYGDMNFTDCSFNQSNSDYHMWTYSGNVTYTDCTFTNSVTGKFLNVYNESGATKYTVTVNNCKFTNNASANKAALNVKATSGSNLLAYDVIINNCTTEGAFPEASTSDVLVVLNSVAQVDDRPSNGVDNITVTQDGVLIYPAAVAAIGETKYPTLQAAVDAAQQMGGEVTVNIIDDISGETVTIKEVANFQLTIDGKKDDSSNYTVDAVIVVDGLRGSTGYGSTGPSNGASVTLQNIDFVNGDYITAQNKSVIQPCHYSHHLTIQDCTYTGKDTDASRNLWFVDASTDGPLYGITVKNVTVEHSRLIQGNLGLDAVFENIDATNDAYCGFNLKTEGTILIKDCQVTTAKYAFRDYKDAYVGTITLEGNTFISTSEESDEGAIVNRGGVNNSGHISIVSGTYTGPVKVLNNKEGVLAISGGYFSEEFPQEYIAADLIAQGKVCAPATDKEGFYTVGDPHYVAQIGITKYVSLAAAVEAAQANDVITMIDDDNVSLTTAGSEITINKPLTITGAVDENGKPLYTIYGSSNGALSNSSFNDLFLSCSTGTVTISNVKFDGFGNEISSVMGHSPVFIGSSNQNAVIENVYISNLNCEGIHINGGTFTIKDSNIDCSKTANSIFTKGICVVNNAQGTIENTKITGVDCDDPNDTSAAIELQGSGNITISGCTIQTNTIGIATAPVGELTAGTSQVTVSDCTVESHNIAIFSDGEKGALTSISSGNYSGLLMAGDNDEGLSISGGLFEDEPELAYCAEGFAPADNTDAATKEAYPYTVEELPDVAKIGDVKYKSLQKALDAAHEMTGDVTITLLDDISDYCIVHQKAGLNVTIDGADKTLAGQIFIDGNGRASGTETLTIQNIKFEGNTSNFYSGTDAFILVPSTKDTDKPWTTGAYNYAHNITVTDCSFTSTSTSDAYDVVCIKATSGAGAYNVVINNCTASGTKTHSLAQLTGTTGGTITNNTVTGSESFVNVSGGTGDFTISGNIFTSDEGASGYGIRENGTSTAVITLTDNTFTAANAIVMGKSTNVTAGTINVESGTYVGNITKTDAATGKIVISGGKFSAPLADAQYADFIADGLCGVNGLYPEEELAKNGIGTAVASVTSGETVLKYASLEAAISAAPDGATVTLLANSSGNGIKVPEGKYTTGLTVDFGGFTYTMDGEMVGSTGTQTQAFQLLKDNKITFKNGTITSEKAKMLVQNYSDLTLEGMTLTLDNPNYAKAYTLSNNNGNVVIDGTTINANPAGAFAFDVCRYSSYPSVSVTVKGTSEINGNIEVSASNNDPKDGFGLTLEEGTFNGNIVLDASAEAVLNATPEKAVIKKSNSLTTVAAPQDYKWVDNGDGTSTLAPCVYVAQIGDVKYESLADAVAAVSTDGTETTITMIADHAVASGITIAAGKNIVLELNGKVVSYNSPAGNTQALITNRGTLVIQDNTDTAFNGTGTGLIGADYTNPDTGEIPGYASNTITNGGTLTLKSGKIVNTATGGAACYVIDNNSTTNNAILNIEGGYVYRARSQAVRMFCNSTTYQNTLNISGGIVEGGYAGFWTQLPGSSGQKKLATINITGGEVKGGEYSWYDYSFGDSFEAVDYSISDGKFTGYIYSFAVENGVKPGFISGGLFTVAVDENYCAEGYIPTTNTDPATKDAYPYTVKLGQFVAQIGDVKYETLEEAWNAVNDGETIKLLADCAGNGIKALQGKFTTGITVDFDGHTYTMDGAMVGSTGTQTQAFQLLMDNKITFKNGTIYSEKAKMLVQNYSDLTLEGMTLTLDNPNYAKAYTLSNNNGSVVIDGTTINANPAGSTAFDVCRYSTYTSVNVTVKGDSKINGDIEFDAGSGDPKDGANLTVEGGTITGNLRLTSGGSTALTDHSDKATVTKSDAVELAAPADFKWVSNGDGTSTLKPCEYVAQIEGGAKYETLEAAFAAAQDGETITLLANTSGNGIKAPQGKFTNGVTVDFAGFTYTMDGATVGSTGTETQAFQLLKDNKITFKNGTIYSEKALMLVQNYSDLTLEGMTLTLNNANYASAYTLSNNNGNVVIDGTTINANPAGGFAFDVCRYSSYPSVSVTVTGNSEINGDVEVSASGSDAKDGFNLMFESATLNGEIVLDASAKTAMDNTPEKAKVSKSNTLTDIVAPDDYDWKNNGDGTSSLALTEEMEMILIHGDPYPVTKTATYKKVTYIRDFASDRRNKYQCWYVPFDYTITGEEGAVFYKIHLISATPDVNGEVENNTYVNINIEKMSAGDKLSANRPYIIKASNAHYEFVVEPENGIKLYAPYDNSRLHLGTAEFYYDFYGTYDTFKATGGYQWISLTKTNAVAWNASSSASLQSYCWYIKVTPNGDNVDYSKINFIVVEEDSENATKINSIEEDTDEIEGIYSANGTKKETLSKGLNIIKYKSGKTKKIYK